MKNIIYFFILFFGFLSCSTGDENVQGEFEFIISYSSKITVGGIVGVTERVFEIGEVYWGVDDGKNTITIRIAEHTPLNDDCPNTWCYQEFLEVPREFLKFIK